VFLVILNYNIMHMKNIKLFFVFLTISFCMAGCEDDAWGNGDPAMEHVYYFGFEDWGSNNNQVKFSVVEGEILSIPVQFHSERSRTYDVVVFYYAASTEGGPVRGTDYQIVDENGTELSPNANGAFQMVWPKAEKGVKNIYVKALNGDAPDLVVWTFDPNSEIPISNQDVASTVNNKTGDYEVRAFSQNHRVTVEFEN